MKKVSVKNLSLLGLVLMAASAVTAAVVPDKSNARRINNGSLRVASDTAAGADQDAPAAVSCVADVDTLHSCTATAGSNTTTGFFPNQSLIQVGGFNYQTVGNTSQTAAQQGEQESVLA
ncbi:hypothetical protein L3C95_04470 [Chitinophaga filiformis]|uniref:hypothetical protein n=1 Tax=Chitinophaga filiformis TaxID=104663 RepID=UPI001F16D90F|nr:hypothetical protein [Chitinophaga filiformis]MCF6402115.1 hypothetical protein [Chitinophaga filiformis]